MAMTSECGLSAVLQATTLESLRTTHAHDVIVVGAGAAGGLAAMLLAESGFRVLVLDAGPPPKWWQDPVRRLTGKVVRRLVEPDALGFVSPVIIPYARRAIKALG